VTAVTVKSVALVTVPPGVVTVILPVIAPEGTIAVMCFAELTVNVVANTLLNVTDVASAKFVPVMTTLVPTRPLVGEKEVIVGLPVTVKLVALSAVPLGVVMWRGPVVAPVGTVAVIWVAESTVNVVAAVVSNVTPVVPQKFVPVITTVAPTAPLAGTKDVSDAAAAAATVKFVTLAVSFTGVVTKSLPVTAPTGTCAVAVESSMNAKTVAWTPVPPASNVTPFIPVKPGPVIVTLVPSTPHAGVKEVTTDADAGNAVTTTPTRARARADAVVRAIACFFGRFMVLPSAEDVSRAPRPLLRIAVAIEDSESRTGRYIGRRSNF
jgi:hypothetical protein